MDVIFGANFPGHADGYAYQFEGASTGGPLKYTNESIDALYRSGNIAGLKVAVDYLNNWFTNAGTWYGWAVGNAGYTGSRNRLETEAANIREYEKPMVDRALGYVTALTSASTAELNAATNPNWMLDHSTPAPVIVHTGPGTAPPAADSSGASLLLPIGAAVAALLFLKGH